MKPTIKVAVKPKKSPIKSNKIEKLVEGTTTEIVKKFKFSDTKRVDKARKTTRNSAVRKEIEEKAPKSLKADGSENKITETPSSSKSPTKNSETMAIIELKISYVPEEKIIGVESTSKVVFDRTANTETPVQTDDKVEISKKPLMICQAEKPPETCKQKAKEVKFCASGSRSLTRYTISSKNHNA